MAHNELATSNDSLAGSDAGRSVVGCCGFADEMGERFVAPYEAVGTSSSDRLCSHVGVVMTLRGADPFLEDTIRGLLTMNYPSHEIRIVIDSQQDPAVEIVERIREEMDASRCRPDHSGYPSDCIDQSVCVA